jgi:DASS family divalent anion:Na+ symporter
VSADEITGSSSATGRTIILQLSVLAVALIIWFLPPPEGVTEQAWHLFAIFIAAILAVIVHAMPILPASILALVAAVLTSTLSPEQAYSGFGKDFILLIVVAFLIAEGVVKSGLGQRIAFLLIARIGHSTLGLAYSMVLADVLIAPAFPSNTARSGVLFPIVDSIAIDSKSLPDDGTRRRLGAFLMMNSMAGLSISSGLWLTAMAANVVGVDLAAQAGVEISYGSWFLAASVPSIVAIIVLPRLLYRVYPPDLKKTPQAPQAAREQLARMGAVSRDEWTMAATFTGLVVLWGLGDILGIDKTAVAFLGLAVLLLSGVLTPADIKNKGDALSTLIWFAILYTLSTHLDEFGFMDFVGDQVTLGVAGMSWPAVYVILITAYVLIHYLFVSQTAQMLALYAVFLGVGINAGVPAPLIAFMLLFATNFFSAITPQGSSANILFVGSGYMTTFEAYRNGAVVTLANLLIFLIIGTPWILFVTG